MAYKILLLAGDGIGAEITNSALEIIKFFKSNEILKIETENALVGGDAIDKVGTPLPEETLNLAKASDSILFGAVGGPKWDGLENKDRPEAGLLKLRAELDLFCNLRPATVLNGMADSSTLKSELVENLDLMIIRELTGGLYFGKPRGIFSKNSVKYGLNTLTYSVEEIARIARAGFEVALKRNSKLCSVDKANVLEVSQLWREIFTNISKEYPTVEFSSLYVDNAAMQLVRWPKQFDVIVTENMFGDILSDLAAMLTGSIGMLPSASLNNSKKGLYEPVHGSAPDIAGQNCCNPIAMIMSLAMMFQYSFGELKAGQMIIKSVASVIKKGFCTQDVNMQGGKTVSTKELTAKILDELEDFANE
ncbi:MAG: 3-isopropylmalate dehydrogenase [Pseudomonadota bacterium]|nr:3-isopropylmalate dehydrogenase [Pseudomonadota bacterium]